MSDGVGELTAFLRGRNDRDVQQGVVVIVVGSSDVPFSAHAPTRRCLPGFGNSRRRDKNVLGRRLLNSRGERLLDLHVFGHRARRRSGFNGVLADCGLWILSLRCRRDQFHRRVGSLFCWYDSLCSRFVGGRPWRPSARQEMMSPAFALLCTANSRQPRKMRPMNRPSARDRCARRSVAERRYETMEFLAATPQWSEELLSVTAVCLCVCQSVCLSICLCVCAFITTMSCACDEEG